MTLMFLFYFNLNNNVLSNILVINKFSSIIATETSTSYVLVFGQ